MLHGVFPSHSNNSNKDTKSQARAEPANQRALALLPVLVVRVAVRARSRAAHEHLAAVEIFDEHADALRLAALGLVAEQLDLRPDGQTKLRDPVPQQVGRRASFDTAVR